MPKFVLLWTDAVLWLLVLAALAMAFRASRNGGARIWRKIASDANGAGAAVVLCALLALALIDSVHFRRALPDAGSAGVTAYSSRTESALDALLAPWIKGRESSYSAPLAWHGFTKEPVSTGNGVVQDFRRLQFGGAHLQNPQQEHLRDVMTRAATGLMWGTMLTASAVLLLALVMHLKRGDGIAASLRRLVNNDTSIPLRAPLFIAIGLVLLAGLMLGLATGYHVLGTDRTGNDVLYQALKSVRTAFVIGAIATLATLPPAVALGIAAGYFKSWIDEAIQYLYTMLSSVPNVLLIAACALMVQAYIDKHGGLYDTGAERADLKLFLLCLILGLTGWSSLCRLVRAESMKLRELDYVKAATAFGVGHGRIMRRHVFPNVVHLVLITAVLDFSGLILYEAVLSFIGVGVDPSMNSFGGMINLARSEMSREPIVWWSFAAAFLFMVGLVLAANLFADSVQAALDPRSRALRPRRKAHA